MSNSLFPIMPLVQPDRRAGKASFATGVHGVVSGKEVRASFRATAVYRVVFTVTLRGWVWAPSPWGAYREPDMFNDVFFGPHRGQADSFLLDNSTGLYIRGGPTQPRVRFTTDVNPAEEQLPGLFIAKVELRSTDI